MYKLFLIAPLFALVTGCATFNTADSSDFGCPGMPDGVMCKTPRQIYNLEDKKANDQAGKDTPRYVFASSPDERELQPVPVLHQAQVMRVWIGPWVDDNKDLHWPGLMFTEVQTRKWNFGQDDFNGVEPPVPHLLYESTSSSKPKSDGILDKAKDQVNGFIPKVSALLPKNEVTVN